jgi:choline kinase
MKCLIIAAGKGSRLRSLAEAKPLISLKDIPLIDRVINSALKAGADDFYVVIGYQGARIRAHLEELSRDKNISVTIIENDEWERANGVSVLKAKKYLNQPFLLLMSDHIFDAEIARQLMGHSAGNKGVLLAVDENLDNPFIDMDDVTRVLAEKSGIQKIGKGIEAYNCFDTGIFLCNPALFSAIEKSSKEMSDDSLSGGIRILVQEGTANVMPINGLFWCDIDDPKNFKQAEDYLSGLDEKLDE